MIPLALGLAGAGALLKAGTGLWQTIKGNRIDKKNPFPVEQANPIFQKNVAIAENMARTGMPQQQYNNALNNIGRNQAGAIRQLGRSANPSAGLASVLRAGNDATINLDTQDANARLNNQRFAFGQRLNLAQEQNRVFDWNKRQKYLGLLAKSQGMIGAGMQNLMGGFNDATRIGLTGMMMDSPTTTDSFTVNNDPAQTTANLKAWMGANAKTNLPGNNLSKLMSQPKFG